MNWLDALFIEIEAYAKSVGIESPEVDIDNHWSRGRGRVYIDAPSSTGGGWAEQEYRIPSAPSPESLKPIIMRAGKSAADHLVQIVSTKH
jgi:hypothetical protein